MKKNFRKFSSNAQALMLLANFLHNVLSFKQCRNVFKPMSNEIVNTNKEFEKVMRRLQKTIDFRADKADKILRCSVTRISVPGKKDAVFVNILPSNKENNKCVIKK